MSAPARSSPFGSASASSSCHSTPKSSPRRLLGTRLLAVRLSPSTREQLPADKGYSSVDNIEAITLAGATPFIAFKSSATGASGGLWEKAFLFYSLHREEFLRHYHQRSNVESTFSMVKAKFRDHVRSKIDVAMKNEVLCKLLCHNIVVVHQSQIELGIEATFWGERPKDDDGPAILSMVRKPG